MEVGNPTPRTRVLVVEDNPLDVRLIGFALREERSWPTEITVADDGEEAIQYLLQDGAFTNATRPDLVILDLNLPKRDGTEVLQTIRSTEKLREVAVIILSSSPEDVIEDRVKRTAVEPNCYFTKPVGASEFLALGHKLRKCYERSCHG